MAAAAPAATAPHGSPILILFVQIGKLEELLRETLNESMRGARQQLDDLLGEVVERKTSEPVLDRRGE